MTTEDDFQTALDANPDDWQARLVFADFLEEMGDPRAEGYRALGRSRLTACNSRGQGVNFCWDAEFECCWFRSGAFEHLADERLRANFLPPDWLYLVGRAEEEPHRTIWYKNRRAAEDAAALAFAKLPRARRAELMAATPVG